MVKGSTIKRDKECVCVNCGKVFLSKKSTTKLCSNNCRHQFYGAGGYVGHGELTKTCVVCGKEFKTYRSYKITCSDKCKTIHDNGRRGKRLTPEEEHAKYLKKHPNARTMAEIKDASIIRKAKLEEEKKIRAEQAELKKFEREERDKIIQLEKQKQLDKPQICGKCGRTFYSSRDKMYCSPECAKHSNGHGRARERYKNITVDKGITLIRLAKRDNNQCQICGLAVNWDDKFVNDKGTVICGDMYPSIDHITPISLGGLHQWTNVQLAHRGCNSAKGNKYIG